MKKILFTSLALATLAAVPAAAQPGPEGRSRFAEPVTRASVQGRVQAQFARFDADRDGFVTQAEVRSRVQAGREERRERRQERRAERFERLDTNNDGSISRSEFEARQGLRGGDPGERRAQRAERRAQRFAHGGGRAGPRGRMIARFGARAFAAMDADRDGRVSLAEANRRALERFDRVDSNRDGTISLEERRSAREAGQARRAQRRG